MTDLNQFTCTGRLGTDPEIRRFNDGNPVANLRVAISETWRDRESGERREKTLWLPVVVKNKGICGVVEKYLKKGSRVALSGKLESRSYNNKNGVETWVTELVLGPFNATLTMLDTMSDSTGSTSSRPASKPPQFEDAGGEGIPF